MDIMKKLKLNKWFILISIFVILVGGIIIAFKITNNEHQNLNPVDSQKEQILDFFYQNKVTIDKIKDTLYDKDYSIREIRDDGYLKLFNNSTIWLPDISSNIKQILHIGKVYSIRSMYYGERNENTAFWLEAFFDDNDVEIDLIYSETDLSVHNNMYSNIEDNWYLFVAGMS